MHGGIVLRYLSSRKNSLPFARNLGVRESRGDIVLFLGDDVVLDGGYLDEIRKVSETRSSPVNGFWAATPPIAARSWLNYLETRTCSSILSGKTSINPTGCSGAIPVHCG